MGKVNLQDVAHLQAAMLHAITEYGFEHDLEIVFKDERRCLIASREDPTLVLCTHYSPDTDSYLVEAYKRDSGRDINLRY